MTTGALFGLATHMFLGSLFLAMWVGAGDIDRDVSAADIMHRDGVALAGILGVTRSVLHFYAAHTPTNLRPGLIAYLASAVIHTMAAATWIGFVTAPVVVLLLAWPVVVTWMMRATLWPPPALPPARAMRRTNGP